MKLNLYGIPESQMREMRAAADLAWRGIAWPPCTQYTRLDEAPPPVEQGFWGRVNNQQTELESSL